MKAYLLTKGSYDLEVPVAVYASIDDATRAVPGVLFEPWLTTHGGRSAPQDPRQWYPDIEADMRIVEVDFFATGVNVPVSNR